MTKPQLFHCLHYRDAERALEFLRALGFVERLVVRDETDPAIIHHAQLQWRDNGGIMLGSVRDEGPLADGCTGASVCNLVVPDNATVDALYKRALGAGATSAQEPENPPHGGRAAGVRDFEGNYWNLDSYPGV